MKGDLSGPAHACMSLEGIATLPASVIGPHRKWFSTVSVRGTPGERAGSLELALWVFCGLSFPVGRKTAGPWASQTALRSKLQHTSLARAFHVRGGWSPREEGKGGESCQLFYSSLSGFVLATGINTSGPDFVDKQQILSCCTEFFGYTNNALLSRVYHNNFDSRR